MIASRDEGHRPHDGPDLYEKIDVVSRSFRCCESTDPGKKGVDQVNHTSATPQTSPVESDLC